MQESRHSTRNPILLGKVEGYELAGPSQRAPNPQLPWGGFQREVQSLASASVLADQIGTTSACGALVKRLWQGISAPARGVLMGIALIVLLTGAANASNRDSHELKISFIGDSIASSLAKALRNPGFDGPTGVTWGITAQPGAGWGEGENTQGNWPLSVVQGSSAARRVRAAAKGQPSAIVIELGTNDALRAAFASSLNNEPQLVARIDGTDNSIRSVVQLASSLSSCVVLVSPSSHPTTVFGVERYYSAMALQVRETLTKEVSRSPHHMVLLADWTILSSTHHLETGSPENWFTADGLHPDTFGLRALANLIVRTAKSCSV